MDDLLLRVAARYKSKTKLESGNTVYEYSERQIADRHRKKAERYEQLRGSIEKLRARVNKDLGAKDSKVSLTALAIALMDHTYERVGNDTSAEDGHFGVTGWQKKHISLGKNSATIKYVGKSGVKHEKEVTDKKTLAALRDAYKDLKSDTDCLFGTEEGSVKAKDVNEYLKEFDVTAKDIRGLHANEEMRERLEKIRSKGGKLPEDKKKREKQLKDEFKEALDATAEAVGHEASTLRSQYLVPSLESTYVEGGTVIKKLNEKTADIEIPPTFVDRVVRQLVDHTAGPEAEVEADDYLVMRTTFRASGGSWELFFQGDMDQHELLKKVVASWVKNHGDI
jgi:DNA topoisomerase-1